MSSRDTMHRLHGMHEILPFRDAERFFRRAFKARHKGEPPALSMPLSEYCSELDRWSLVTRQGEPAATVTQHGQVLLVGEA